MNRSDFNRSVARATGESLETIARRGFVLLTRVPVEREPPKAHYEGLLRRVLESGPLQTRDRVTT